MLCKTANCFGEKVRIVVCVVFAFIGEGTVKQTLVDYVEENNLENG